MNEEIGEARGADRDMTEAQRREMSDTPTDWIAEAAKEVAARLNLGGLARVTMLNIIRAHQPAPAPADELDKVIGELEDKILYYGSSVACASHDQATRDSQREADDAKREVFKLLLSLRQTAAELRQSVTDQKAYAAGLQQACDHLRSQRDAALSELAALKGKLPTCWRLIVPEMTVYPLGSGLADCDPQPGTTAHIVGSVAGNHVWIHPSEISIADPWLARDCYASEAAALAAKSQDQTEGGK